MFLETLRAIYGLLELVTPGSVSRTLLGKRPDDRLRIVLRILGARHLVQAAVSIRRSHTKHALGGTVDLIHSLSMVTLAIVDRRRRQAATLDATIAALFAAGELRGQ